MSSSFKLLCSRFISFPTLFAPKKSFHIQTAFQMANSRFEYIREYEDSTEHLLMPDSFLVIRIDGKQFHRFSKDHDYLKPNDKRGLDLMNEAAKHVMKEFFPEIVISYGQSDEYSFVFHKNSRIYNRRQNKLISIVVSAFSSAFVFHWSRLFSHCPYSPAIPLNYPPSFDSRCVLYPTESDVIDYLKWRQVDCHINNVYNTTFYALTQQYVQWRRKKNNNNDNKAAIDRHNSRRCVAGGEDEKNQPDYICSTPTQQEEKTNIEDDGDDQMNICGYYPQTIEYNCDPLSPQKAEDRLKGSVSQEKKYEILKPVYGIDYEQELEQFRRGSLIILDRERLDVPKVKQIKSSRKLNVAKLQQEVKLKILSEDLILDEFWQRNPRLLESVELG